MTNGDIKKLMFECFDINNDRKISSKDVVNGMNLLQKTDNLLQQDYQDLLKAIKDKII